MNKHRGILAIDFDDTIADTSYPEIHGLKKDAREYINKLYSDEWYIIIWTCRANNDNSKMPYNMMFEFLQKEGINYHKINEQHDGLLDFFGDTRKISADYYIDDKNIFGLPSWKKIYKYLSKVKINSSLKYLDEVEI